MVFGNRLWRWGVFSQECLFVFEQKVHVEVTAEFQLRLGDFSRRMPGPAHRWASRSSFFSFASSSPSPVLRLASSHQERMH
jgi:hypothetical protein